MRRGCALIVFSREPSPGRVKTRLAPKLGAWGAARLQRRLILAALGSARAAGFRQVELHGTPRPRSAFFRYCAAISGATLRPQRGADLGERMYRALRSGLRRHRTAILIGTDCPALRPADLRAAARVLRGGADIVLAPAEDGGYALIGARRVSSELFRKVEWGSGGVLHETAQRLAGLRYRWRTLRMLWDIDRPQDLERFRALRLRATPRRAAQKRR